MPAQEIRVDYNSLTEVAHRFRQRADTTEALTKELRARLERLESGGWQGRGAEAFFREMHQEVLPAAQRLILALENAQRVTNEIVRIMREAEEEAARPFGRYTNQYEGAPGGINTQPPLVALPMPISPSKIFNPDYMDQFVGIAIPGADSPQLNAGMLTLLDDNASQQEIDRALQDIAQARGIDIEIVRAHYQKYLEIKAQIAEHAQAQGKAPPWETGWVFEHFQKDFVGSTIHLRYGKVVGDAIGLDPAFAALLNPTGGIVGPGEWGMPTQTPEDPLAYHGIFHDASGFLYNNLGIGPGYDYLGREPHRDTWSPLTGQEAGIHFWNEYWERRYGDQGFFDDVTNIAGTMVGSIRDIIELPKDIRVTFQRFFSAPSFL